MEFIDEEKFKNKHGIYCIINRISGDTYVGQTSQRFVKRYWHHQWKLKDGTHDNKHLQNAWNLYGEEYFSFTALDVVDDEHNYLLDGLEEKYIKIYRDMNHCYNILDGGKGLRGFSLSEEHKRKIGEKNRINMTGKKHSEETKRKMSEARKGKHTNRSDYRVTMDDIKDIKTLLITGMKPSDVARELNVDYKAVNAILSNNCWQDVQVDGWDEFRENRKTWKRLSKEDHKEIYRLYSEEGLTKQELVDIYGKSRHMINKIIKKFKEQEQKEQEEHYKTIQCEAS